MLADKHVDSIALSDAIERELLMLQSLEWLMPEHLHYMAKLAAQPEDWIRLVRFTEYLKHPVLKLFMVKLLNDEERMEKFVTLPASKAHHHHQAGGLLTHSLEVTQLCFHSLKSLSGISANEQELTVMIKHF